MNNSNKKYTVEEFADKVNWEGGLFEAITGYGLSWTDLDDDAPAGLVGLLKNYEVKAKQAEALEDEIMELLESDEE